MNSWGYVLRAMRQLEEEMLKPLPRRSGEDWRSLCCSAAMRGEPFNDPGPALFGWCAHCGNAAEFVVVEDESDSGSEKDSPA